MVAGGCVSIADEVNSLTTRFYPEFKQHYSTWHAFEWEGKRENRNANKGEQCTHFSTSDLGDLITWDQALLSFRFVIEILAG